MPAHGRALAIRKCQSSAVLSTATSSVMELLLAKMSDVPLKELVIKAKDWALLNGLALRPSDGDPDRLEIAPFTLLPSMFPRACYEEALAAQPLVNEVTHRVAQDLDFLGAQLAGVARADEFTRRLLEVAAEAARAGPGQSLALGLLRADYMLQSPAGDVDDDDSDGGRIPWSRASALRCKQVEVNTIASGHGWIGTACSRLHRYIFEEMDLVYCTSNMPDNYPLRGLCLGMYEAWKIYGNPSAAILFIVEDGVARNIADQRQHEYELHRLDSRLRVLRRSLAQVARCARLEGPEGRLVVEGREIGLVYLRYGYAPEHYAGEAEWRARLLMERSRAVKCPTVGYQLAGTKKIQQVLARPGTLERFLPSTRDCRRLRRLFTGMYALDMEDSNEWVLSEALRRPGDFVLKPQREGGANNLFGAELRAKLDAMRSSEERSSWILMDRIAAAPQRNYLVRPARAGAELAEVTSELGVFGVALGDAHGLLLNEAVGHALRSKLAEYDEGGVSSGYGVCDSPFLT